MIDATSDGFFIRASKRTRHFIVEIDHGLKFYLRTVTTIRGKLPRLCTATRGFTLVELVVVIGIISVLIAFLLPAMVGARRHEQAVRCASNMRQITAALINYANENQGQFPPNTASPRTYWNS